MLESDKNNQNITYQFVIENIAKMADNALAD